MENRDSGSFSPHEFNNMDTTMRGLLGRNIAGTFRLDDDTSVGLALYGTHQPIPIGFGIMLRERAPVRDVSGTELYPYRQLMVSFNGSNPLLLTEVTGLQARNRNGILKEWNAAPDFAERERLPRKERNKDKKELIRIKPGPINPEPYVDALYQLKTVDKEDVYGRIAREQLREKAIVEAFEEESSLLLRPDLYKSSFDQPLPEGMFGETRHQRRQPQQQSYYLPYDDSFLFVREERRGFAKLAKEAVVYHLPHNPSGTIWQYERRRVDNRLIATAYAGRQGLKARIEQGPNPLDAVTGDIVVDLLRSVY